MDEEGKSTDVIETPSEESSSDPTAQLVNNPSEYGAEFENHDLPKINECPTVYTFNESHIEKPDDNNASGEYDLTDGTSMDANFDDASSCCISEVSSVSFQNMSLATEVDDLNVEGEFDEEGSDTNNEFQDEVADAGDTPVILGHDVNDVTLTTKNKTRSAASEVIFDEMPQNFGSMTTKQLNDKINVRSFVPVVVMPSGYENIDEIPPVSVCKPTDNDSSLDKNKNISGAKSEKMNPSRSDDSFGRRSPGLARRFLPEVISHCDDLPKSRSSSSLTKPGRAVRSAETTRDHKSSLEANQTDDRHLRMCQMDAAYRHHVAMVMQKSYESGEQFNEADHNNHINRNARTSDKLLSASGGHEDSSHTHNEGTEALDESKTSSKKKPVQVALSSSAMPSVEDGLSSGNSSDADEVPSCQPDFKPNDVPTSAVSSSTELSNGDKNFLTCRESFTRITGLPNDQNYAESSQLNADSTQKNIDSMQKDEGSVQKEADSLSNLHKTEECVEERAQNVASEERNGRVRIEIATRPPVGSSKPGGSLIDFGSEGEEEEAKKRDMDVERAIRDIKNAIQQSKKTSLRNPENSESVSNEDPVWITRTKTAAHGQACPAAVGLQTVSNVSATSDDIQQAAARHSDNDNEDDDDVPDSRALEGTTGSRLPGRGQRMEDIGKRRQHRPDIVSVAGGIDNNVSNNGNQVTTISDCEDDGEYFDDIEEKLKSLQQRKFEEYGADEETDELLDKQYNRNERIEIPELPSTSSQLQRQDDINRYKKKAQEVLMEGVLFRAAYLGSTQLISEGQPSKAMRMMQAQEAVGRIKAADGENQPRTEVDLFVSVEKLMVLNTDLQEIMMDYSLRTISYIADVGDILVLMARRGPVVPPGCTNDMGAGRSRNQARICCHLFESDEAQLIAQSIGQAFQVAYLSFLKANGIQHPRHLEEMDYQEVLNQQEIFGEELYLFSNRDMQREILIRKQKGELLGVVIVESGWGSMVPTVVLANMCPTGAAARCGRLNIGDQIMSINDVSLVGLPLSTCQSYIKASKYHSVVKLTVVSCPPVVEVLIKRPDIKYQLGFSVQNGVICSLLRGGIAERGGVRVGHHIIEINGQSVVAVSHERIVNMLATSVGEISMKTMPTSIYRLLTGQDAPHYI